MKLISIVDLHPHPGNPRLAPHQDVVDQIAAQLNGAMDEAHALIVRQNAEGYEILSGHHRRLAAIKAGLEVVPCHVREMSDEDAYMALALCNAQRELTALERGFHALNSGMSVRAYAKVSGEKPGTVQDRREAAEVADACRHVPTETLSKVCRHLAEIHAAPSWLWPALVEALVSKGWPVEKVREQVARVKELAEPLDWMNREVIATAIVAGTMKPTDIGRMGKAADIVLQKATLRAGFTRALQEQAPASISDTMAIVRQFLDQQEARSRRARVLRQDRQAKREAATRDSAARREALLEFTSLEDWPTLTAVERSMVLAGDVHAKRGFNKQENADIEWAKWSWNPITGCLHDCPYCYARDIAHQKRMADVYPNGFAPTLKPRSLLAPRNMAVPGEAHADARYRNVFTGSMTDLFGRWVPEEWINAVLREMRAAPDWNFLCLTKFPKRMAEFDIPINVWMGTSVDLQARVPAAEAGFAKVKCAVKWLSIEPMLEPLTFKRLDLFDWMVVGGASRSTQTPEWHPPSQWVYDLRQQAETAGVAWYEKSNLWGSFKVKENQPFGTARTMQLPQGLPVAPDDGNEAPAVFHYLGSKSGPKAVEAA